MNTLKLRELAAEYGGPVTEPGFLGLAQARCAVAENALLQAADYIDKLRAHCRQQRKEIRRLNTAHCVRLGTNPKHAGSDIEHRIVVMQQQVNSWHKGVEGALVTLREHVEEMEANVERLARFVGCVNTVVAS